MQLFESHVFYIIAYCIAYCIAYWIAHWWCKNLNNSSIACDIACNVALNTNEPLWACCRNTINEWPSLGLNPILDYWKVTFWNPGT